MGEENEHHTTLVGEDTLIRRYAITLLCKRNHRLKKEEQPMRKLETTWAAGGGGHGSRTTVGIFSFSAFLFGT